MTTAEFQHHSRLCSRLFAGQMFKVRDLLFAIPGEHSPTPQKPVTSCLKAPLAADEKKQIHQDSEMQCEMEGF